MKLFILLAVLFIAGFFMQSDERKPAGKKPHLVSHPGRMISSAPAFDPYKLKAGEARVPDNAIRKYLNEQEAQKELIALKKISKDESQKNLLIWEMNIAADFGKVKAKKYEDAEIICQQGPEALPENGWVLMGLYNSLEGEYKIQEMDGVEKRSEHNWKWSDSSIKD